VLHHETSLQAAPPSQQGFHASSFPELQEKVHPAIHHLSNSNGILLEGEDCKATNGKEEKVQEQVEAQVERGIVVMDSGLVSS